MTTLRIDHVGLTVAELDRSLWFYCQIAGLELISRSDRIVGGTWYDTLTGTHGARVQSAYVGLGAVRLQLVQYRAKARPRAGVHHAAAGSPHLCLVVADVRERHNAVRRNGLDATPIVRHELVDGLSFYVDDPDGVPVEFFEELAGASPLDASSARSAASRAS